MLADLLAAAFQIAFDHETLEHAFDVLVVAAGVEDILADSGLLIVFLGRVGVIGVNDQGDVLQAAGSVSVVQIFQIFKMVIGDGFAVLVDIAAHNGVGQIVAGGFHFPAAINKGMAGSYLSK